MKTPDSEDFAYAMTPFKILSWPTGTWPLQTYDLFALMRFIAAISSLLLVELILFFEMIFCRGDAMINLDILTIITCSNLALSKLISFRVHSAELVYNFVSAVKDYTELNDEKKRVIMRRHAYRSRIVLVCVMLLSNLGLTMLCVLSLLMKDNENVNVTVEDELQFPFPSKHVILLLKIPDSLYILVFLVEYAMLMVILVGNLGSDLLFFAIVFHVCGQVEILKAQFNGLIDEDGKTRENFHSLIERHKHLLELSGMLNDAISWVLVVQLLTSCILICTGGFQLILGLSSKNIVVLTKAFSTMFTFLIQLFSYSYVSNYLKSQMDDVGFSLYSCSWYNLPVNVAKNVVFVIQKSQIPVCITAGQFYEVNLETYMSILKTSISYLSVLRVMITV